MFSKVKCQMKKSQFKMAAAGLWFSLLSSMAAQAQDCDATATITLINQAQVDNFATTYGACDATPYGLTIEGSDITQVDALSALVTIKGDLKLYAPALADLTGFANLETIEGALHVGSTSAGTSLVNVDALSKVTTLGGLVVYNNDLLEDLDGLSGVTRIAGDV